MARLSADDVDRIARLARIELTPAERDRFATELGAILDYAGQIARADTASVEPFAHAPSDRLPERADVEAPCLPAGDVLGRAPDGDPVSRLFRVPRVLGG